MWKLLQGSSIKVPVGTSLGRKDSVQQSRVGHLCQQLPHASASVEPFCATIESSGKLIVHKETSRPGKSLHACLSHQPQTTHWNRHPTTVPKTCPTAFRLSHAPSSHALDCDNMAA